MKAGKVFLILWALIFPALLVGHASPDRGELFKVYAQGNSEYQKGNYESAERLYHQLLNSGADSSEVYYNLGNACFKLKKLGEAIYYWEKAQQKAPADRDIRENLQFANLMVVDRIETQPDPLPLRILSTLQNLLSVEQESWLVLALFVAANLLFTAFLTVKTRNSFRALIASTVLGALFVVFGCSLSWKIFESNHRKQGIVTEQKVDVRSGPGLENIPVFTIHEGIKVRVLGSANDWYQISLPNGWNGWLPRNYIRLL